MEDVINFLLDIEEKANRIIHYTNEGKQRLNRQSQEKIKKLDEFVTEETETRLAALQESLTKKMVQEKNRLLVHTKTELEQLELRFQEEHDQLAEQLFQLIITRSLL